jgi:hypothetical protein
VQERVPSRKVLRLTSNPLPRVLLHDRRVAFRLRPNVLSCWVVQDEPVVGRAPGSGRMQQVPRLLDIGMHLPDQCLFPGVLHLATEPGIEVDRDLQVV